MYHVLTAGMLYHAVPPQQKQHSLISAHAVVKRNKLLSARGYFEPNYWQQRLTRNNLLSKHCRGRTKGCAAQKRSTIVWQPFSYSYQVTGNYCIHTNINFGRKKIRQFTATVVRNQKKVWILHFLTDDPAFVTCQVLIVSLTSGKYVTIFCF